MAAIAYGSFGKTAVSDITWSRSVSDSSDTDVLIFLSSWLLPRRGSLSGSSPALRFITDGDHVGDSELPFLYA